MNWENLGQNLLIWAAQFGVKILGAILLWIIGRALIGFAINLMKRALLKRPIEPTVVNYLASTVAVLLNITLIVAILGYFGVQTTTFAALIASAGLAVGLAWSGLLSNFAAGAFLMILRPFKTGEMIQAGGVLGVVEDIGLFVTTINTPDNIRTFVGNAKIFNDNIQNFSANAFRRVDLVAQLNHSVDPNQAITLLKTALTKIPNVVTAPPPDVEILEFTPMGPVLAVRPYTNNQNYWQVYFDTNRLIRNTFGEAGFPAPGQFVFLKNSNGEEVFAQATASGATH
ncbi:MAG TPA: mechanosensitive ion channel family protein [Pyrinomonadaceae bacterium]|nr:mechanosensitive ion channel family protein [Pyrinomonadaceae bacterium]